MGSKRDVAELRHAAWEKSVGQRVLRQLEESLEFCRASLDSADVRIAQVALSVLVYHWDEHESALPICIAIAQSDADVHLKRVAVTTLRVVADASNEQVRDVLFTLIEDESEDEIVRKRAYIALLGLNNVAFDFHDPVELGTLAFDLDSLTVRNALRILRP